MANKEYKSDVFSMLLQDKKRAMEIYNAINGTDYDDPELVEMTTLDDKSFSLTVLGKMAHSERRGEAVAMNIYGEQDMKIFESGVAYFK